AYRYVVEFGTRSIRLRARELGHLAPFLGFVGDEITEVGGRAGKWRAAELGDLMRHLGIGERRIDLAVELVDDFDGRVFWRTKSVPWARLVTRHEHLQCWQVRQRFRARRRRHRKPAQLTGADVLKRSRDGFDHHLHLPTDEIG